MKKETTIVKDLPNRKLHVTREFTAPLPKVWKAWTESELLDKWWAPRPWKAETKVMDFRDGGHWLYAMAGPNGERHWCKVDFITIEPERRIVNTAIFVDEHSRAARSRY